MQRVSDTQCCTGNQRGRLAFVESMKAGTRVGQNGGLQVGVREQPVACEANSLPPQPSFRAHSCLQHLSHHPCLRRGQRHADPATRRERSLEAELQQYKGQLCKIALVQLARQQQSVGQCSTSQVLRYMQTSISELARREHVHLPAQATAAHVWSHADVWQRVSRLGAYVRG